MQPLLFKTRLCTHTVQCIGLILTLVILYEAIAFLSQSPILGDTYFWSIGGFGLLLVGILLLTREYPHRIYKNGIKFSIYWGLKNGAMFVPKEKIVSIKYREGKYEGTKGIEIETKNGKKYLIVKFYMDQVFPYLEEMMDDLWQEVYKG